MMRALLNENGRLTLGTSAEPQACKKNELKVSVICASLNPTDTEIAEGQFDWLLRLMGVRSKVRTGLEFAGVVEQGNSTFAKGERVFGNVHLLKGPKTHQEEICVSEDMLARIPDTLSFEQAAGIAISIQTSLVALESVAKLKAGDTVLINGATGGVGVYAIQVAKFMGLDVTAIGGGQEEFMRSLGADHAFDYNKIAIEDLQHRFDAVLDLSTFVKFRDIRHLLKPAGRFIPFNPIKNLTDFPGNFLRSQKVKYLMVDRGRQELLERAAHLISQGHVNVVQGPLFPLEEFNEAYRQMEKRKYRGRMILRIQPDP